jgi:hypothetical protein
MTSSQADYGVTISQADYTDASRGIDLYFPRCYTFGQRIATGFEGEE